MAEPNWVDLRAIQVVVAELEKTGWKASPHANHNEPGSDILAQKGSASILVEVKARTTGPASGLRSVGVEAKARQQATDDRIFYVSQKQSGTAHAFVVIFFDSREDPGDWIVLLARDLPGFRTAGATSRMDGKTPHYVRRSWLRSGERPQWRTRPRMDLTPLCGTSGFRRLDLLVGGNPL